MMLPSYWITFIALSNLTHSLLVETEITCQQAHLSDFTIKAFLKIMRKNKNFQLMLWYKFTP